RKDLQFMEQSTEGGPLAYRMYAEVMGPALVELDEPDLAINLYERGLQADDLPGQWQVFTLIAYARALASTGRVFEATEQLRAAIAMGDAQTHERANIDGDNQWSREANGLYQQLVPYKFHEL